MKKAIGFLLILIANISIAADQPLALHPANPHYFLFRGKATPLITSAEHYGAVLNRDFDYTKYLDELKAHGFNLTRIFTGAYCEDAKSFGIARNTLAPKEGKLICPWARSDKPGYAGGGNKFDLGRFDEEYFTRLKAFLREAGQRGIVVELALFCPFYEDSMWNLSPMNSANNINGFGAVSRQSVYDFKNNGDLQTIQEALVKKLAIELNRFDNLYFEICNEPYFGGVTEDWQTQIIYVLADTEKMLPNKHLISLNIANGSKKVVKPNSAVSILNFHYTSPPTAVKENYALNRVIGENETGFKGTGDTHYRMEAWEFLLAGGGLYNNLDYSFAAGYENGTFTYPANSPGGGNLGFRRQIAFLKRFLEGFELLSMKPDETVIQGGLTGKSRATVLSETGKQYAAYFFHGPIVKPKFALPGGSYKAEWYSPRTGELLKTESISAKGSPAKASPVELISPQFDTDMVLRIKSTGLDQNR